MKNKTFGFIIAFVFIVLFGINAKAEGLQSIRLQGTDRYGTNIAVIQQGWQKSDYAVIVNGNNFPDALSAAPLAKKYNAPIILTNSSTLNSDAILELQNLGVKKAFLVGGTGAISASIESLLNVMNITYERLAGENRDLTSIAVANEIGTANGVVVTTDSDYTDALSVASIAGKLQMPIILSQKDTLDSIQKKFISTNTISKTYILGNTDIISDNVASKFPNVQRIATEDNRYARNLDIINTFANNIDFSKAILASGENFPDALGGSAFAALNGNPIFLVGHDSNYNYLETLLGNKNVNILYTLGGISGISDKNLNSMVGEINALETIKSKITLDSNLSFRIGWDNYSYDGSNYYTVSLYERRNGLNLYNFYQYNFLVDTETGDTYKIDTDTKKITPLDNMKIEIDSNNAKEVALETVADNIVEKDTDTALEYLEIKNKNNTDYYYIHAFDDLYDHISTVDWYYVDVNTGKAYIKTNDENTLSPIN